MLTGKLKYEGYEVGTSKKSGQPYLLIGFRVGLSIVKLKCNCQIPKEVHEGDTMLVTVNINAYGGLDVIALEIVK